MALQDHYQVLNITSAATAEEIKKSFRKLALKYHPDKNTGLAAAEKYAEIQEAYFVLKDKTRRAAYHYQRYLENPRKVHRPLANTPEDVWQHTLALHKRVSLRDPHRLDRDLLFYEIDDLLSAHNLHILETTDTTDLNTEIVKLVTACTQPLSWVLVKKILAKLAPLAEKNEMIKTQLQRVQQQSRQHHFWSRYMVYIALVVALLVCFLIYFSVH